MEKRLEVPKSYTLRARADLVHALKQRLICLGLTVVLCLACGGLGMRLLRRGRPIAYLLLPREAYIGWAFALVAAMLADTGLHLLGHCLLIRSFTGQEAEVGCMAGYLYARPVTLMEGGPYLLARLLPLGIQLLVLVLLCLTLSGVWAPMAYLVLMKRLAGSADDLLLAWPAVRVRGSRVVIDEGLAVRVYGKERDLPQ